ncbi:MAG: DUF3794 domain-containing protein [Oscillospiraceae bacterium]|nr:DUF3794 domain-containing protein [Oscillospiraceae bacterium]
MEVKLSKTELKGYDEAFSGMTEQEGTQEMVVPDTLPDIGAVVCTNGTPLIRSKDLSEGQLRMEVNVPARIVCRPEDGQGVYALEVNIPLTVVMENTGIHEKSLCVSGLCLNALETRVLNPRKVSVRAVVGASARCFLPEIISVLGAPEEPQEGQINMQEREISFTPVCAVTEKTFVLVDKFALPAGVRLLGQQTRLEVGEINPVGTKLVVKGSAKSCLLYSTGEDKIGTAEFSTDFSQIIEAEELPETVFPEIALLLSSAYYDVSGENRTGKMELHLVAQAVVYGKRSAVCLTDAYSNRCALTVETGRCTTGGIQSEQTLRETLRETLQTPQPVSEIVQGCAALCAPRAEDGALTVPVTVCIYYRSADGSLNAVRRSVQARFSAQLPAGETAIPVSVGVGMLTLAPDGTGVEVLLPLELRIFVEETEELSCVTAITCEEGAAPDFSDRPSLVIERAGADRDLWAAARENGSTVQGILDANGLEDAAVVVPGQMLLIPKMA